MTCRTAGVLVLGLLVASAPIRAQRERHPDLQGVWIGATLTPLQRPPEFKDKAAFTLRLDPDRHLKLRLACAVKHRSAQQIVSQALDEFLQSLPELDALAQQVPARAAAQN